MLTHPSFKGDHSNKQEYLVIKKSLKICTVHRLIQIFSLNFHHCTTLCTRLMSQGNGLKTRQSTKLQLIKELMEAF